MVDIVRVQVKDGDEYRTIAQLEEPHAKQYISDIASDNFDASLMHTINHTRNLIQKEDVFKLKSLIDNALFSDGFRIIPVWEEGQTQ